MLYRCSYFAEPSDINLRISRIGCIFHQFPPTQAQSSYKLLSLTSTHLLGDHGWRRSIVLSSKTCFHVELWIYKKKIIDNQSLVTYINGASQTTLPDWGMKPLTHDFFNSNRGKQYKVFKISRTQNITARSLARQAYSSVAGSGQSLLHTKLSQPPLSLPFFT